MLVKLKCTKCRRSIVCQDGLVYYCPICGFTLKWVQPIVEIEVSRAHVNPILIIEGHKRKGVKKHV